MDLYIEKHFLNITLPLLIIFLKCYVSAFFECTQYIPIRRVENDDFITGLDRMKIAIAFPNIPNTDTIVKRTPSIIKRNIILSYVFLSYGFLFLVYAVVRLERALSEKTLIILLCYNIFITNTIFFVISN